MKRFTRLSSQVAASMVLIVLIAGLGFGESIRRYETEQLKVSLSEQANLTVSLLNGLMIEAIIIEDTPILESAMMEAVDRIPSLLSIALFDDSGHLYAKYPKVDIIESNSNVLFASDIILEGENFGFMQVNWSTALGQSFIEKSVREAQIAIGLVLLAISALFLILVHFLVIRSLSFVHQRMEAAILNKGNTTGTLPIFASTEFLELNNSVTLLETTLSERQEREEALILAKTNADMACRAKSEFLANMSHEIRTPMNGVIGMAELILETPLSRDQRIYAKTISESGSALLTIINDILDFSKIEAGKLELDLETFNLETALEDVVTLLATKSNRENVEVNLRYHPSLPKTFQGDVGRIRQIITNVAGNAVKFTQKGHVLINVTGESNAHEATLNINIEDTGIGIPEKDLEKIFNEFEQVNGASNRKFEGTGLGLAITSRLLKLMNGKITATSELNCGSTFTISITLPNSQKLDSQDGQSIVSLKGKNFLIVDDLAINQTILSERLNAWGGCVTIASSGKQALDVLKVACQDEQFDIAILDYQMPNMDGAVLARKIRVLNPNLPIIVLSSIDLAMTHQIRNELGISDILLKPARSEILQNSIMNAIDKRPTNNQPTLSPVHSVDQGLGALNVLVAEDNKTNQLVLKAMLKKTGVEITICNNGKEACDRFLDVAPDLVLMDMSMPEMDGLEATRRIRQLESEQNLKRCPIIALTANAMTGDKERCLNAGMDDYLTKPINKAALFSALQRWSHTHEQGQKSA